MIRAQGPGLLNRLKSANQRFNGLLGRVVPMNNAGGLLGVEEAQDAQRQGQLALASSLLQASGPSLMPTTFGQNLGGALAAGQVVQNQALDTAFKRRLIAAETMGALAPGKTELGTITLENNGQKRTFMRADTASWNPLLTQGWTEVRTPAATINLNQGGGYRPLTDAEVAQAGLPPGTVAQVSPDGKIDVVSKPSEGEERNAYASQNLLAMNDAAEKVITDNPDFDPSSIMEPGLLPVVGDYLASQPYRQFKSAADEWTTNVVFLRSGATAREEEKSSAFKNYWPQPLDSDRTKAKKELLRLEQMQRAYEAGRSANRIGSEEANRVLSEIGKRRTLVESRIASMKADKASGLPPLPDGFTLDPE